MIIGATDLKAFLEVNNGIYWNIRQSMTGPVIYQSSGESGLTLEDTLIRFDRIIPLIQPGDYSIETWTTYGAKNNHKKEHFKIGTGGVQSVNGLAKPAGSVSEREYFDTRLQHFEEKTELKQKLADFERRLNEGGGDALGRIIEKIEPFLPAIMGMLTKNPAAPAVAGPQTRQTTNTEQTNRFANALETWHEKDPESIEMIEAIARLAHTDPEMYKTAKEMLKQQTQANNE